MEQRYDTLREFWPYYLSEHLHPVNRALHAVGSLAALGWVGAAIALRQPALLVAALVSGYAFAWIGHFGVEKNRPATFRYPFKSFLCDWLLLAYTLTFRVGAEVERLEAAGRLPRRGEAPAPSAPSA